MSRRLAAIIELAKLLLLHTAVSFSGQVPAAAKAAVFFHFRRG
jgi:hypothetical protein